MVIEKPRCKLIGIDGNAWAIIGKVAGTLRKADMATEAKEFTGKALNAESYSALLALACTYVEVS